MPYVTKKLKDLNLNYEELKIEPIQENGIFTIHSSHKIEEITILVEEQTNRPIESVNNYLIHRHLLGKDNSSFEVRGLRLYFDFLEAINKSWLDGSSEIFNRPISLFSKYIKSSFEKGEISGTVAISYFNSVVRFYKYHLEQGQQFNGVPITFSSKKVLIGKDSLLQHIYKNQIEINVADYSPNIPYTAKSSELKPLSKEHNKLLFKKLKSHTTREFFLICLIAQTTGLRASEISNLKLEQVAKYNEESIFNLYVGPQVGHHTKGNQNGVISVNKTVMDIIKEHTMSSEYLKRLAKFKGEKPLLFLNIKGRAYTQKIISTMFNEFINEHIKKTEPEFTYKFHDLRATFGVSIMKACLDQKMERTESLAYTQHQMRHKSIDTTLKYLEYWTHSMVNKQKSKLQEELLESAFSSMGDIFNGE